MSSTNKYHVSDGSDDQSIKELIENSLANADIAPLLRLIFSESGASASEQAAVVERVQSHLYHAASDQELSIQDVSSTHALDISRCVLEIQDMKVLVNGIKDDLSHCSDGLEHSGVLLADRTEQRTSLLRIQGRVLGCKAAASAALKVMKQACEVAELLKARRLYPALMMIERIRDQDLASLYRLLSVPSSKQPPQQATWHPLRTSAASPDSPVKAWGGVPSGSLQAGSSTQSVQLRTFFTRLINELLALVEQLAITCFNDWLVSVRRASKQVGMRAIRKAAIVRKRREDWLRERRRILGALEEGRPVSSIADELSALHLKDSSVNAPSPVSEPSSAQQTRGSPERRASKKGPPPAASTTAPLPIIPQPSNIPSGNPSAACSQLLSSYRSHAATLARQREESSTALNEDTVGPVEGLDMTGLTRCVHIHSILKKLPSLFDYYMQQRRLQVITDLAPPATFLESYQGYLAQVVGFFSIEAYVRQLVPELFVRPATSVLWEEAVGGLKGALEGALEALDSAPIMLLLKDFVLLVCRALNSCGCMTSSLEEVLVSCGKRYHSLLSLGVASVVSQVITTDTLGPLALRNQRHEDELVHELSLPLTLEGGDLPSVYPCPLPFSISPPAILKAIRGYVADSAAYLDGLVARGEMVQELTKLRDDMIMKVVVESLLSQVAKVAQTGALVPAMRCATNVWVLLRGLDAMQLDLGGLAESVSSRANSERAPNNASKSNPSPVMAALRGVQDTAERIVARFAFWLVDSIARQAAASNWTPPTPLGPEPSAYVEALMARLQDIFNASRATMSRSSHIFLFRTLFKSLSSSFMRLLTAPDGLPAFNGYALERLAADLLLLERWAASSGVTNLAHEILEPMQLCRLLTSETLDEVVVPELRRQRYPALDLSMIVLALDKYKEVTNSGRQSRPFASRKAMVGLARQLRGQMVTGVTSSRVLEGI